MSVSQKDIMTITFVRSRIAGLTFKTDSNDGFIVLISNEIQFHYNCIVKLFDWVDEQLQCITFLIILFDIFMSFLNIS